ncbi:hypothetical protein ACS0TY_031548 [Phlomoides rotata]
MTKLGKYLKVPIVQELAKEKLSSVPSRYVRRPDHHHPIPSDPSFLPQIPVIDMHKLFLPNFIDSELDKLHNACKEWGFFQLLTIETMKSAIQEFFNLPIEEKSKFCQEAGELEGYGQLFILSEEQKLDWADVFFLVTSPHSLTKSHLIPKLPSTFRDAIEAYSAELNDLALKILNLMVKALGMKAEDMKTLFDVGMQSMRMNYYPPCPQPELVMGLYPHSDVEGLTILLQVNEKEGLQIKKDGVWIPVSPLPDAFVVNIGDALVGDCDQWYIPEHRASGNCECGKGEAIHSYISRPEPKW